MNASIESIYEKIGNAIVDAISEDWTVAWIEVNLEEEDSGEFKFLYQCSPSVEPISFARQIEPRATELYQWFEELRRLFHQPGKSPWKSAIFTLKNDGTFNIKHDY